MAAAALVVAIVSLVVAGGSVWFTRAQAIAARDDIAHERRLDDERKRDRAGRLKLEFQHGPMVHVAGVPTVHGAPSLKLTNESDVAFTAIDVAYEALEADTPHSHIEHIAFMDVGATHSVNLPQEHARLMVTWRDPNGVLWRRRFVGVDYELERLS